MSLKTGAALAACRVYSPWAVRDRWHSLRFRWLRPRLPAEFVYHSCIFINLPRVAGDSIATALFGRAIGHHTLADYERVAPEAVAEAFVFTFVRNPWDRLHSAYRNLTRRGALRARDARFGHMLAARYPTFERFVEDFLDERTLYAHGYLRPQWHFLRPLGDASGLDFVGRFERMEKDFRRVARRLAIDAQPPRLNRVRSSHYEQAYTADTWARVGELYHADCQLFGYTD